MAKAINTLWGAAVAAVLLLSVAGVKALPNVDVFHIAGKVVCQDCSKGWNEWRNGKPIKGAKVGVMCLDNRQRVVSYASDGTDGKGEFDLVVSRFVHGKAISAKNCRVRLLSSPDAICNVMTDFGGGKCGVEPRHLAVAQPGLLEYAVGPFFFTSRACDVPETLHRDPEEEY